MTRLVINQIGGNCPVQAEGVIDGYAFYFRARGMRWFVEILDGTDGGWEYGERYSDEPYAAGWMTEDEARSLIAKAAELFRLRHAADDDGQPSERGEWRDFDPDC